MLEGNATAKIQKQKPRKAKAKYNTEIQHGKPQVNSIIEYGCETNGNDEANYARKGAKCDGIIF